MSGTSVDGVDNILAYLKSNLPKLVQTKVLTWPDALRRTNHSLFLLSVKWPLSPCSRLAMERPPALTAPTPGLHCWISGNTTINREKSILADGLRVANHFRTAKALRLLQWPFFKLRPSKITVRNTSCIEWIDVTIDSDFGEHTRKIFNPSCWPAALRGSRNPSGTGATAIDKS